MRKLIALLLMGALCLTGCTHKNPSSSDDLSQNITSTNPTSTTVPSEPEPEPIPEPERGTEISVRYRVNSPLAGSLQGIADQTVYYGQTTTSRVTVTANPGYRFTGWSDGYDDLIRGYDCPKTDTVYTAIFEYDPMELPMVHLTTSTKRDVTSKTHYIDGTITLSNCAEEFAISELDMEIRGRGNSSWDIMEKKSYRLRLSEKQNLLNLGEGKAKSWVLLAVHADQALLRNHITMEYARTLGGMAFMPASTAVDLYLNGEYRGVYFLCEQIEVNSHRVNIAEQPESLYTGYFLEMSAYAKDPRFSVAGKLFEIKNDLSTSPELKKQQIDYIHTEIERCWNAVVWGDEKVVRLLIDVPSVVDAYLVEELFKNKDDGWDSFYLYFDASVEGEKLHFGPIWDFDLTGGNTDNGADLYEGLWAGVSEGGTDNPWFIELMKQEWFRALVVQRWNEVKEETMKIPVTIIRKAKENFNSFDRNFEKWPTFGDWINQQPPAIRELKSYTEHYNYYAKWMQHRIAWLDNYYNTEDFIKKGP